MNELALFAGAGGGILAGKLLGHRTICAVEINAYCASVLLQRQNDGTIPPFPIWDDVRTFEGMAWRGRVDMVSGGFPCQAYSTAAAGKNTADDLWPEMRRIVADVAPRHVFAENVSREAIYNAANDLESMGYKVKCLELSAKDMGADHIRERCWLLAHADMHGKLRSTIDAEVAVMPGVCPRIWEAYPDESRMDDGLAYRVDRLKATGNGQVPIVAATAYRLLGGL
jgi:DNA (cytosine-5)-methyltransferase 1